MNCSVVNKSKNIKKNSNNCLSKPVRCHVFAGHFYKSVVLFCFVLYLFQALLLAYTKCKYIKQNGFSKPIQSYLHSCHVGIKRIYLLLYYLFFFWGLWKYLSVSQNLKVPTPMSFTKLFNVVSTRKWGVKSDA